MGRPSKISDKLISRICESIAKGNTRKAACEAAGISHQTLLNWLKSGEGNARIYAGLIDEIPSEGEQIFIDLFEGLKKAEADAEEYYLDIIHSHAVKSWQCAAWWLERRKAGDYSRQDKLDVTTKSKPITEISFVIVDKREDE